MIPSSLPKRCLITAGSDTERLLDSLFGHRGVSTLESPYCLEHFGDERKEQTGSVTHWQKPMYKSWELGSLWFNSTTKLCLRTVLLWSLCPHSPWMSYCFQRWVRHAQQCVRRRCGPARALPHGSARSSRALGAVNQSGFPACAGKWVWSGSGSVWVAWRGSSWCRHFALTWHVYKTVYGLKV